MKQITKAWNTTNALTLHTGTKNLSIGTLSFAWDALKILNFKMASSKYSLMAVSEIRAFSKKVLPMMQFW